MPTEESAPRAPSRVEREALAGEILGASVVIPPGPGRSVPLEGTLVDESLSTFTVRLPGRRRLRTVPKPGLTGTIVLPSGELPLRGESLRVRPEDRTKRLLAGGPRRVR